MTDNDLQRAARIVAALADALDSAQSWASAADMDLHYVARDLRNIAHRETANDDDRAIAAELLAAARREVAPASPAEVEALRRVVGAHQPETVDVDGACDRYGSEPGSGCCGACDLTATTTVCTCGSGLDLQPCPTLVVVADELGVVLDADAPADALAARLAEHLDARSAVPPAAVAAEHARRTEGAS